MTQCKIASLPIILPAPVQVNRFEAGPLGTFRSTAPCPYRLTNGLNPADRSSLERAVILLEIVPIADAKRARGAAHYAGE